VVAGLVLELPRIALKQSHKVLLVTMSLLIGLPALSWTGTFLYWHVKIRSSIRAWEKAAAMRSTPNTSRTGRIPSESASTLLDAGCRALPYLVKTLDESTDPEFQEAVIRGIIELLMFPASPNDVGIPDAIRERNVHWQFIAEGPELERKEKLADFRTWWESNGGLHHQWWRVWSSNCHAAR